MKLEIKPFNSKFPHLLHLRMPRRNDKVFQQAELNSFKPIYSAVAECCHI